MSYYWFNRQEILQRSKERYYKEKAAAYYSQRKEAIKEKSKNWYKNFSQEENDKIKGYQIQRYQQLIQHRIEALQNKRALFLLKIRVSEKTLKFNNIRLNKKEFYKSKQPIDLESGNVDQIVVSDKFKKVTRVLNISLVTKKTRLLNRYLLSYIKWVDT